MAINKKLIHFQTLENFNTQLSAGNILDTSIVFIKDAKKIWTHGQLYDCSGGSVDTESQVYVTDFTMTEYGGTYDMDALADAVENHKVIIMPWGGEWTGFCVVDNAMIDDDYITLFCRLNSELNPENSYSGEILYNFDRTSGKLDEKLVYAGQQKLVSGTTIKTINGESLLGSGNIEIGGGSASGDYLPLTGGTLTGALEIGNAGAISTDDSDNLQVSISETMYIDNDVRSTYGSVTLEDGSFKYKDTLGNYVKATGLGYNKVSDVPSAITLYDDVFYDLSLADSDVTITLAAAQGSGHYTFLIYVQPGYSITLPSKSYFVGDEPTESGYLYEVSIYGDVIVSVKVGARNIYGGQ